MGSRHLPVLYRPVRFRETPAHALTLRVPGREGQRVRAFGELTSWEHPLLFEPASGGQELALRLDAGVYAYKFCAGPDDWFLDPSNPRTRSTDGNRNSVVVVGGTPEPLLHVPAAPYLWADDSGQVIIRAAARRDALGGDPAWTRVRFDEGHGAREVPLERVGTEDEHDLLEAVLPVSARRFEYCFVLPDGGLCGRTTSPAENFSVNTASLRRAAPQWWRDAAVYTVLVDRFRAGGRAGAWPERRTASVRRGEIPRSIPNARIDLDQQARMAWEQGYAGGDLRGVIEGLDHLEGLGVTALHLTPVFESRSSHRYDVVDFKRIDPNLGGEEALRALLDAAHQRQMRVILDLPLTHVHRDFWAFADVRERGWSSPYWDWFYVEDYPFREGHEPGYRHYPLGAWQEPLLRTDHEGVVDYLRGVITHWATFGVDGFRIDAAAELPRGLLAQLRDDARAANRESLVFAEVIPSNLARWTASHVDAATDFASAEVFRDWLRGQTTAGRVADVLARQRFGQPGPGWTSLFFSATHDQHRIRTHADDARIAQLAAIVVCTRASTPMLLYGDEIGMRGEDGNRGFEDVWSDREPMSWDPSTWDEATLDVTRSVLDLRRRLDVLRRGDETTFSVPTESGRDAVLCIRRVLGNAVFDVLCNGSSEPQRVQMPSSPLPAGAPRLIVGSVDVHSAPTDDESPAVTLGPWSAVVLERGWSPVARRQLAELRRNNRALAFEAFRQGSTVTPSLPANLYVTVTEACNLSCEHCITHAPRHTREGSARSIQPWLLEALEPALAVAEYIGFSHGGESAVSPMLPEVLRAIARARDPGTPPCDIHLLSNGMLMTPARVHELARLGVNSLAVSLDAADPDFNDGLRKGGEHAKILANLRGIVALREREGLDLRVGISSVVTRTAAPALEALGRLALELGVDWLKFEEVYPVTERARHEYAPPDGPELRAAADALREAVTGSKLVLVDHLRAPSGCACQADPGSVLEQFLAADGFANRATFNHCRMAWEQACIDPDGTVHPTMYEADPVGSLAEASFEEIWNSSAMQRERQRALGRASLRCRSAGR